MTRKTRPSDDRIRELNALGGYHPEIAEWEIRGWEMKLTDLLSARDRARTRARDSDDHAYEWHGLQRALFDRIERAGARGY